LRAATRAKSQTPLTFLLIDLYEEYNMTKSRGTVSLIATALILVGGLSAPTKADEKGKAKTSQFDMLKALAGEWSGKGIHGDASDDATIVYKVTSGGSAVVETLDPGGEHEMVTVFHQDGDDVVLTHYCMLGNQPRMKAERGADAKKISFKFSGAGNLKSDKDPHMHDLTIEFVDADHIKTNWTFYNDGKADSKAVFDLKRKKK
jgi:hypothetical protein